MKNNEKMKFISYNDFESNMMKLNLLSPGYQKSQSRYQNMEPDTSNIKIFKPKNQNIKFNFKINENCFWPVRSE